MPTGSEERTNARKEEIINACEQLYQTQSFREITIKEIGQITSCSRTSIYNYFETKEEIFLALLKREYDTWVDELNQITESHDALNNEEIADAIAHSLDQRHQLLTDFKVSYGNALHAVMAMLGKFRPDMDLSKQQEFVYAFFPFMFGIYPYTVVTEKQKKAMQAAGVDYIYPSLYALTKAAVLRLLS